MFHKVQVLAGIRLLEDQMLQLILEMEQVVWSRKIADRQLFKLRWKTNWRDQSNQLQDENGDDDDYDGGDGGDDDDNENGLMMILMSLMLLSMLLVALWLLGSWCSRWVKWGVMIENQ